MSGRRDDAVGPRESRSVKPPRARAEAAPAHDVPVAARAPLGTMPVSRQQAIVQALARSHGNAHVARTIGNRTLARMPVAEAKQAVDDAASGLGTDEEGIYDAIRQCDDREALGTLIRATLQDELAGFERWRADLLIAYGAESQWPSGLLEIFEASEGAGTDEGRIFDALNALDATKAAALAAVPGLKETLNDELSGFGLKRALLMLQYGGEAGWPKGLKEVLAATEGLGTDEAGIVRALAGLTEAEAQALAKVPGLMALIEDELSGPELQAAKDYLSGAYARTLAAHKANVAALQGHITTWRGTAALTPLQRNTLDFLFPATGSSRLKVRVLTPTHDAAARAKEHGEDGVAYFGADQEYPDASGDYDADVSSKRNIYFASAGVVGTQGGGGVEIMDVSSHTPDGILATLVHELQHYADHHAEEPDWQEDYKSPEESWQRYKTEFRAWWIDGDMSHHSDTKGSAAAPFDNRRQKAIFDHFMSGNSYTEWLKPNYDGNKDVHGHKFKDLVHGYTHPEGVNLINSPRIDDLYGALSRASPSDNDVTKAPLADVMSAAGALNANDLTYVNSNQATSLQEMAKSHLSKPAFDTLAVKLGSPPWASVNIAPARRAILAAGKGLGTNEQAIYDAIATATPDERAAMEKDPAIQAELEDELSGKELWRARQYLKYGPKADWPKAVAEQDS